MTGNQPLRVLRDWAGTMAENDIDLDARPLWRQIATEVGDYLDHPAPPGHDEPMLDTA